jgi:plasmid stability protein
MLESATKAPDRVRRRVASTMAAVSIRDLDDDVKDRLRVRAARNGRSMEAEIRAILTDAVSESDPSRGLFTELLDRFGEIGYGVERLPHSDRATAAQVFSAFAAHVLAFDADAAGLYGDIAAARVRGGAPIDGFDAQIAAICRLHGAALATRNVRDFEQTGVDIVDPWSEASEG